MKNGTKHSGASLYTQIGAPGLPHHLSAAALTLSVNARLQDCPFLQIVQYGQ
jgi:hypothetical protein